MYFDIFSYIFIRLFTISVNNTFFRFYHPVLLLCLIFCFCLCGVARPYSFTDVFVSQHTFAVNGSAACTQKSPPPERTPTGRTNRTFKSFFAETVSAVESGINFLSGFIHFPMFLSTGIFKKLFHQ